MNHTNIRFYLTVGFFAFIGVLVIWSKFLTAPSKPQQNNFVPLNNGDQSTQAETTDQDTKNLETTIEDKLKNTKMGITSTGPPNAVITIGDLVQQVSVTKEQDGGFRVLVNFNIVDTNPQSPFYNSNDSLPYNDNYEGLNLAMSGAYVAIYKYNPNANIDDVIISASKIGTDNYGNQKQHPLETNTLSKSEASNYNWSLDDRSLEYLVFKNLKKPPLAN